MAGKPCTITPWLKTWYEEAGFVDVREEIFRLPTCGWPEDPEEKIIGTWMEEMMNSGIDGILRAYQLRVAGLTMEQHQVCTTITWDVSVFDLPTTVWASVWTPASLLYRCTSPWDYN